MQEALTLLGELLDEDLQWLLEISDEVTVEPGARIITEGATPECLYIVLSGLIGIRAAILGEAPLAHLGPGELLGEISFLEGTPASATAVATELTALLEIPRIELATRLEADAAFAVRFYRALALLGARRLRERVGTLGAGRATLAASGGDSQLELGSALAEAIDAFKDLLLGAGSDDPDPDRDRVSEAQDIFCRMQPLLNELVHDDAPGTSEWRAAIGRRLQSELLPLVLLSRFGERCYTKPRGYAGDYLTIKWIYEDEPAGQGSVGKMVDAILLDSVASRAVRNRRGVVSAAIRETLEEKGEGTAHVASFACGPAEEVFDVLDAMDDPSRLLVELVDIDWEALGHVSARVERERRHKQVKLHHANLIYLATGKEALPLERLDLVYSIGLTDYFEDRFVVALLNYAHHILAPGGRVLLGNFHPRNVDKAFMDHVVDWKLIHRTEEDMNRILVASHFGKPCTRMRYEEGRVNLFAECVKS